MNILVVYPYIPFPLDRGTYQRTFHLLRELSREHSVDILALSENGERMEHRSVFEEFCNEVRFVPFAHPKWPKLLSHRLLEDTPTTVAHWRLPHVAAAIRDQLESRRYDLVHVCDIVMGQYFLEHHKDIPLSIDRSRVDLQFQQQQAAVMRGSLKDRISTWENIVKLEHFEIALSRRSQLQVLCGPDDETFVREHISGSMPVKVIANGADLDFFNADASDEPRAEKPTVLFCGAMDYTPNVDALRWYFDSMHEALRARVPELQVLIVGKSPAPEVVAYGERPGVTVTGSVPDVRPFYRQAWLQMVPLRIGGGTRLKIVESLAIGTPVVSTTIGAQGLALDHNKNILLADDAPTFVEEIVRALGDGQLRNLLRSQGISTARARFSWRSIGAEFTAALTEAATKAKRMSMMGVPFDRVTMEETIDRVGHMIAEARPSYIATANVDFLVQATHDRELHSLLKRADMVVCDGTPLVWLSRMIGRRLPERVAGSDLVPQILARAEKNNWSVFFLGGRNEVLAEAVRNVREDHPTLRIAGAYSPPFAPLDKMDNDFICNRVRDAKPDILLVSFGCPKQEKWIARHCAATGVPVSIGVGATIDFLAKAVKRAPLWMQRSGLEWVYRLAQEPRRLFKRYSTDLLVFSKGALQEIRKYRKSLRA